MEDELRKLEEEVSKLNREYAEGRCTVPDQVYDAMLERLRSLDPDNPLCTKVQRDVSDGSGKVEYGDDPMLSLQKFYDLSKMVRWIRETAESPDQEVQLQPKYDGVSAQWDGMILSTRGDGHVGQDVSRKAKFFERALMVRSGEVRPLLCHAPLPFGRMRGELICSRIDFEVIRAKVLRKDGSAYSNGRNFIAGVCNAATSQEDDDAMLERMKQHGVQLSFVPHDMVSVVVKVKDVTEELISSTFARFKDEVPFEQDGIVVKLVGDEFRKKVGSTDHHPRWAAAFKVNEAGRWCKVVGCEWTVAQDGSVTPTLKIEPAEIGGVVVSNVLAHSFQYMKDNGIATDGGTMVSVLRSGEVIPFICDIRNEAAAGWGDRDIGLARGEDGRYLCPECGMPLSYRDGDVDAYCVNRCCPGMLKKRMYNAASKCFEIKGLAESTIAKMYDRFGVRCFYQMLDLSPEDLSRLDGFAWDSAVKLWNSIHSAVDRATDVQVLSSLGIRLVGRHVARDVLSTMPLSVLREKLEVELYAVGGIGAEKARSLVSGLRERSAELDELLNRIPAMRTTFSPARKAAAEGRPTICFTGEAPMPRSKCQELARRNGYEPVSGVSKSLSVLVCASTDTNSTKAQKARKYGTKVVSFDEWYSSLENKDEAALNASSHGNAAVDAILEDL